MIDPNQPPDRQAPEQLIRKLRNIVLAGLVAFPVLTVMILVDLNSLESRASSSVRIFAPAAWLYNSFGYWPAVLATPVLGAICIPAILYRIMKLRELVEPADKPAPPTTPGG